MRLNLMITSMDYDGPMRLCEFDGDLPHASEGDRGIVGRSKSAQFPIADASVSRQHFRISYRSKRFWIRNLSKNGTSINGQRLLLQADEEASIATGDRIYAGEVEILVTVVDTEIARSAASFESAPSLVPDAGSPGLALAKSPLSEKTREKRYPHITGESPPRHGPAPIELEPAPAPQRARTPFPDDFDLAALLGIGDAAISASSAEAPPSHVSESSSIGSTGGAEGGAVKAVSSSRGRSDRAPDVGGMDLIGEILAAAGLTELRAREIARNLKPLDLGQVFGASVRALAGLQSVRERFARNFRLNTRDLAREGNNPFQHSEAEAQIIERLFQPDSGFLAGVDAVNDAELDLQRHQVAVAEALRRTFLSLIECFRPDRFEADAQRGERSFFESLTPGARDAAAWRAFREMYVNNFADGQRAFLVIYLDRFRKDYEEVLSQTGSKAKRNSTRKHSDSN